MEYRVATLQDVDSLVEIERKYFSNPWTKNQFAYEIGENEFSTVLVCEDDGRIVGFLVYWILFDNAQICNVCVTDEYKKKGIASTLFDMAEEEFKKNYNQKIYMNYLSGYSYQEDYSSKRGR